MAEPFFMSTVLVTGANRGIGLALCRRFARRGDTVIGVCRQSSSELDAIAGRVEANVDVTSDEAVTALARRLQGTSLDIVVLNAGILRGDDLDSVKWDDVRAQIEVNAVAPLRVAQALHSLIPNGGKLVSVTSRMGSMGDNGSGGYYGYRMSKAALNAATVSLARDLRVAGVAVAALHPGYVRTELTGQQGNISADESARLLADRIDQLTLETSGSFWHASGEELPW